MKRRRVAHENTDESRRSTNEQLEVFKEKLQPKLITIAEINEGMNLSNCILQCRVEYVVPPAPYRKQTDGSEGLVYKFILSDGISKTMDVVAFCIYGQKVFKKLRSNECFKIRGEITAKLRDTDFVSESNTDVELQFGSVDVQRCKDSPMQSYGLISLSQLGTLIMEENRFIRRISNVVVTSGSVYQYDGCSFCFSRIKDVHGDAGKYYCTSNSWKCEETRKTPRDRKQLLIFHSITVRDENEDEEVDDLTIYDSGCRQLLESLTKEKNYENADPMLLLKLIGCKVDLRIRGYRNDKGYCKREILSWDIIERSKIERSDEYDNYEEENSDESNSYDFELPPELPEVTQFSRLPLSSSVDTSEEAAYSRDDSKPRGLVFFLNIENITNHDGTSVERRGSECDRHHVTRTLKALGYDFFKEGYKDLSSTKLSMEIESFKSELKQKDYSSLLVIITSHGNYNGVAMSDGVTINFWTDVVYEFADSKFPEFKKKPKIFIPGTCRYFTQRNAPVKIVEGATRDILVLFPCMPGYSSKRDPSSDGVGTWFIHFLMKAILKHYDHLHLIEIVHKVQKKQDKRSEQDSSGKIRYQCGTYDNCLFKKFYF